MSYYFQNLEKKYLMSKITRYERYVPKIPPNETLILNEYEWKQYFSMQKMAETIIMCNRNIFKALNVQISVETDLLHMIMDNDKNYVHHYCDFLFFLQMTWFGLNQFCLY